MIDLRRGVFPLCLLALIDDDNWSCPVVILFWRLCDGSAPKQSGPVDRCEFVILFVTYLDRASACARLGALEKQSLELFLLSVRLRAIRLVGYRPPFPFSSP
jgi:hypothetical protein